MKSLSVGIITYNEEKRIGRTLESVKEIADEIIIVDSHSTDKTREICEKHKAKVFIEDFKGYGLQKNSVIEKCTSDYILLIDADEVVSRDLKIRLIKVKIDLYYFDDVYKINFISMCFKKKIKHGGWSNIYRIRLFKNGAGIYDNNEVHEQFITDKKIAKIDEAILHHTYESFSDYLEKFNRYTSQGALEYFKKNKKSSLFRMVFSPILKFIRMYFIRLGFLDGIEGLFLAIFSSNYTFVKYLKLRELGKNSNEKFKKNKR